MHSNHWIECFSVRVEISPVGERWLGTGAIPVGRECFLHIQTVDLQLHHLPLCLSLYSSAPAIFHTREHSREKALLELH